MAYDASRRRVVLYGGVSSFSPGHTLTDTWEFDAAGGWVKRSDTGPTPRGNHRLVYDSARRQVVLLTGRAGGTLIDFWAWNGSQWSLVTP
jgi:hypothetical protein